MIDYVKYKKVALEKGIETEFSGNSFGQSSNVRCICKCGNIFVSSARNIPICDKCEVSRKKQIGRMECIFQEKCEEGDIDYIENFLENEDHFNAFSYKYALDIAIGENAPIKFVQYFNTHINLVHHLECSITSKNMEVFNYIVDNFEFCSDHTTSCMCSPSKESEIAKIKMELVEHTIIHLDFDKYEIG